MAVSASDPAAKRPRPHRSTDRPLALAWRAAAVDGCSASWAAAGSAAVSMRVASASAASSSTAAKASDSNSNRHRRSPHRRRPRGPFPWVPRLARRDAAGRAARAASGRPSYAK